MLLDIRTILDHSLLKIHFHQILGLRYLDHDLGLKNHHAPNLGTQIRDDQSICYPGLRVSGRGVSDEDAVELPLKEGLEPLSSSPTNCLLKPDVNGTLQYNHQVWGRWREISVGWGEFN